MQSNGTLSTKPAITLPQNCHSLSTDNVVQALQTSHRGLKPEDITSRLNQFGPNKLPQAKLPGVLTIFFRQFLDPLIYVLLFAAIISLIANEITDAFFIFIVLLLNSLIGSVQEYSAQKSAASLQQLITRIARVERQGEAYEINAEQLVPGDIVLLESGDKVPADCRLIDTHDLLIDESLLTGESAAVEKNANCIIDSDSAISDHTNMVYSGTLVASGRARGIVVASGMSTQLGIIADAVLKGEQIKPPLLIRMHRFTVRIAMLVGITVIILSTVTLLQGMPYTDVLLLSAALAVSTIPEGLPVAITVVLSISMRRMSKLNVIVRRLVTVEALGSCTYIASDKTGTLTVNKITAKKVLLGNLKTVDISGEGIDPEGKFTIDGAEPGTKERQLLMQIATASTLPNEALLAARNGSWTAHGDAVDIAFLVLAHKAGVTKPETMDQYPQIDSIPYESSRQFSAVLNQYDNQQLIFVKGATEKILSMCSHIQTETGKQTLDPALINQQIQLYSEQGFKTLAIATGAYNSGTHNSGNFSEQDLNQLTLLGVIALMDPLRPEAKHAVAECQAAGVSVAMVTGDHPVTAMAIARELGLASNTRQLMTGQDIELAKREGEQKLDDLISSSYVFARVEPKQKLDIVQSLQRHNHFVAVTGDGANDAPALRSAHVGVAMGLGGTDVAKESSDMILTDNNFKSIVDGIREGRVAYANVRKVIFLLISTGGAEIVLFFLSLLMGLPLPLTAVQLLWLNLVTNGIQDIALAFEPEEGNELKRPPRSPDESVFNRLMIQRVAITALTMGITAFMVFSWLLEQGYSTEQARNSVLLLMVLFENVHVFNSRSEFLSVFRHNPMKNKLLLFGTILAQLIHISAMYIPGLNTILEIQPVEIQQWLQLLQMAMVVLIMSELHKLYWKYFQTSVR